VHFDACFVELFQLAASDETMIEGAEGELDNLDRKSL